MSFDSFNLLVDKVTPFMSKRTWMRATVNGPIEYSIRVACLLRYLAGGSPYDMAVIFGVSIGEVYESVWEVADVINQIPEFSISYPACHAKQEEIALGFEQMQYADFQGQKKES